MRVDLAPGEVVNTRITIIVVFSKRIIENYSVIMAASCLSLCIAAFGTILLTAVVLGMDETVDNDASGADLVHAVIIKLSTCQETNFNISDHHFLRRIAYVETKDGVEKYDNENELYGIWAVNRVTFSIVNAAIENLSNKCGHLSSPGCFLSDLSFDCARKPLYSGLIAKLYLRNYEQQIPTSDNITGQAQFWHNNYHGGGGGPEKFENDLRDNISLLEGRSASVLLYYVGQRGLVTAMCIFPYLVYSCVFPWAHYGLSRIIYVE